MSSIDTTIIPVIRATQLDTTAGPFFITLLKSQSTSKKVWRVSQRDAQHIGFNPSGVQSFTVNHQELSSLFGSNLMAKYHFYQTFHTILMFNRLNLASPTKLYTHFDDKNRQFIIRYKISRDESVTIPEMVASPYVSLQLVNSPPSLKMIFKY